MYLKVELILRIERAAKVLHIGKWIESEVKTVESIIIAVVTALAVSIIYCRISAIHTFNVIDGFVNEIIDLVKALVKNTDSNKWFT